MVFYLYSQNKGIVEDHEERFQTHAGLEKPRV